MADTTGIQPYNYPASQANDFERLGHPGRYYRSITCTSGITTFTGSNFGVGAIIVPTGSVGTIQLSDGGEIPLEILSQGSIRQYEFSISSINVSSGTVYALVRNQLVR
jgi:hypothetical protein